MSSALSPASLGTLPALPTIVVPKVTVASLAVYSVMGAIGWGLTCARPVKHLGEGLIVAAFVGSGYAVAHAIVANVAPKTLDGVDVKEA